MVVARGPSQPLDARQRASRRTKANEAAHRALPYLRRHSLKLIRVRTSGREKLFLARDDVRSQPSEMQRWPEEAAGPVTQKGRRRPLCVFRGRVNYWSDAASLLGLMSRSMLGAPRARWAG